MTSPHYHLQRRDGAEKLVVFLTAARAANAPLNKFDFWATGKQLNAHCLFINNGPRNEWYQAGIPGLSESVEDTLYAIERIAKDIGAKETVFVGVSMGGYGALLYAIKSGQRAMAFGPETRICLPASRSEKMIAPGTVIRYPDLADLVGSESHPPPPLIIFAAQRDPIDLYCISLLHGKSNCRLNTLKSLTHGIAGSLSISGRLIPLLEEFISGKEPAPLKELVPLNLRFAKSFYDLHRAVSEKRFKDALSIELDEETNDQVLVLIAKAHMGLRQYPQALAYLYRAKQKVLSRDTVYLIGHCYFRMKEYDHAILIHEKSSKDWPNYPKPLQDLTLIYEAIGNLPEALRCGVAAANIIPNHAPHAATVKRIQLAIDKAKQPGG